MASIFTRIIQGELPGRFVWRDERCVAFLTINPIRAGHTLVVPVAEVDRWTDLDEEVAAHLMVVAQRIARAQDEVFSPDRIGLMIAGFEVPHTHLHVLPIDDMGDLDLGNAADPGAEALDAVAESLRKALGTAHLA